MATCNRCGHEIEWGRLPGGRWVALELGAVDDGRLVLFEGEKLLDADDDAMVDRLLRSPSHAELLASMRRARHAPRCGLRGVMPVAESIRKVVPYDAG